MSKRGKWRDWIIAIATLIVALLLGYFFGAGNAAAEWNEGFDYGFSRGYNDGYNDGLDDPTCNP